MSQTRDFFKEPEDERKDQPQSQTRKIIRPRMRHDDTPSGQEERKILCDFIKEKGGEDYFNSPGYSNYQIEMIAASRYEWVRPEGMI